MRRSLGILAVGVVVTAGGLVVGVSSAVGQEPAPTSTEVAEAIAEDGWYAHPDSVGDREQLAQVAVRLSAQGEPMGFALVGAEPPGSSPAFAEAVLDELAAQPGQRIRTVVVLSDADVGVVSDRWSDQAIDDALDATIDELRADPTDGLEALADALAAAPAGFDEPDDASDDDSNSTQGMLVLGVLVLGGIAFASRYWSSPMDAESGDDGSSWSSGRRRSFYRSSSSRHRSSSSSGSSRRSSSSSSSHRGRGGRRL